MYRLLISVLLQSLVVVFVFPLIDSGFRVSNHVWDVIVIVLFFGFLNFVLRWFLVLVTFGVGYLVYLLTLGLAGLVVNAIVLFWIATIFPDKIFVPGFWAAFWGGAILTLANYVAKRESKEEYSRSERKNKKSY
ncbi:phage holin family protein [Leptospira sp. SA-E8]|uniref:phage holin family protein n=1 Tax=Leptospira sp. SA-E8 TaxID=3422259 RepID=UPI003EBCC585